MSSEHPIRFDTKIVIVVRDDLPTWQKMNMTAFLASAVAAAHPGAIGEPYYDADGTSYLAMLGQPVLVFAADADGIRRAFDRALARAITPAVFTEELFATGNDSDNRAAVAAVPRDKLALTGLSFRAPKNAADKITKGLVLHS
jgi:hypothetical protein